MSEGFKVEGSASASSSAPSAVAAFEKAKTQQLSISKGNSPKQRSPKGSPRPKKSAVTSARSAAANTADGQKSGRKSAEQLKALNDEFKKTAATPEESTIDALAITIGLSAKDVRLWFHRKVQQQRNKAKQNGIPKSGKSTSTNKNNESNDDAKTAAREPIAPARLATVIAEISEKYGNQGLLGSQSRQRGDDKQATDDILSTKRKYDELEIAFGNAAREVIALHEQVAAMQEKVRTKRIAMAVN